jgi:hypothetical protein
MMIGTKFTPALWALLILGTLPVHGQSAVYDILLAGRDVGELKIEAVAGNQANESFRVQGAINTLFYDVVYVGENLFEKGVLKSSLSTQEVNGNMKEKTRTYQTPQNSYQVVFADAKAGRKKIPDLPHPISHTVTSLYYREPVNLRQVYSERFGQMCALRRLSASSYEVVMPDGKKATYHYRAGRCQKVESEIVGIGLLFQLRENSVLR